jgi:hypothetical protein
MITDKITESITIHDKYRFEIKLDLSQSSKYYIEYYFFIPASLNISYYTYDKSQFYSSLQRYIRFKNPEMDVYSLFNISNINSPYNRVLEYLDKLKGNPNDNFLVEAVIDELKLVGSILKSEINEMFIDFKKSDRTDASDIISKLSFIDESFENLNKKISSFNYNNRIKESFKYVDEYLTIVKREGILDIIKDNNIASLDKFQRYLEKINNYCDFQKYINVSGENADYFLYHKGLLKKFVSSCLFLKAEPSFNIYYHIVSGTASAVAMLFAVIVTVYAQTKYSLGSIFFVLIAVISYVFKDRIKEFVKVAFSKNGGRWVFDRKIKITEPTHNIKIGNIKESFSLFSIDSLPGDLILLRNKDNLDIIDEDAKLEVVLKYRKEISLNNKIIDRYHIRRKKLTNIVRFSIFDFLKHTDDAEVSYNLFKDNRVVSLFAKKTYHINIIVKYFNKNDEIFYDRYRIIFNRSGILKVEKVF